MRIGFSFDSKDSHVQEFFSAMGFDAGEISAGYLSEEDLLAKGINPLMVREFLSAGVSFDDRYTEMSFELSHPGVDVFSVEVSDQNAQTGLDVLRSFSPGWRHALFRTNFCSELSSQKYIYENLIESLSTFPDRADEYFYQFIMGTNVENKCLPNKWFELGVSPEVLKGIHFDSGVLLDRLKKNGRSIVPIHIRNYVGYADASEEGEHSEIGAGSAVIVSSRGHVITTRHVLFNDDQLPFTEVFLEYRGKVYPVQEQNILYEDHGSDLAVLLLPDLARIEDLDYSALAKNPPVKDEILLAIGFPGLISEKSVVQEEKQTVTIGQHKTSISILDEGTRLAFPANQDSIYHETSVGTMHGNSGGGFFNLDGNLVGIASFVGLDGEKFGDYTMPSYASSVVPIDVEDERLQSVLQDIVSHSSD